MQARLSVRDVSESDSLLYMVRLLHTHSIRLRPAVKLDDVVIEDETNGIVLPAITQRHAAEVIASLWPEEKDRGNYAYWYWRYNQLTPYGVVDDIPAVLHNRLDALRQLLLCDPRVEGIARED